MLEKARLKAIDQSRLSVKTGNDVSCTFFNGNMVLVLLESRVVAGRRYDLFFRPNTYDYVVAKGTRFTGCFEVDWDAGSYGNIESVIQELVGL